MRKPILTAAMLLVLAVPGAAIAGEECRLPMAQWQPREAVQKMAAGHGWKVARIRVDDGCYQIKGLDETGHAIKVTVDPVSLAIVSIKHEGRDDADHRPGTGRLQAAPPGVVAAPANGLFGGGAPPKVQVQ